MARAIEHDHYREIRDRTSDAPHTHPQISSLDAASAFHHRYSHARLRGPHRSRRPGSTRYQQSVSENQIELQQIALKSDPDAIRPKAAIKKGDLLGRLDIPRLNLSVAVLQGTSSRMLRLGTGHIENTPLPGEPGNSGIAGHRDTFFRGLKDVRAHDEIQFQTATGLLRYQVDWVKVVAPDDVSVLAPSTESALTLVTCYPFYFVGPSPQAFCSARSPVLNPKRSPTGIAVSRLFSAAFARFSPRPLRLKAVALA